MFIFGFDGCRLSEIDLDSLPHYCFAIEDLSDSDSRLFVEEGDYDAAEGFERCPRVDRRRCIDEIFDSLEVVCAEDFGILEVGDEKGI